MTTRLAELPTLFLDAQATAASPARGALVEIGWARGPALPVAADVEALVVAPPPGTTMPRAVARITGVSTAEWERGVAPERAWRRLSGAAARLGVAPAPVVVHYARFEEPHLAALHQRLGSGPFPFELVCTHAIARRLLPGLPRRTLRALAGYFGAGVPELRRAADHVVATAIVWRHLVEALAADGVNDMEALRDWLARPAVAAGRVPRVYPLDRDRRLAVPRGPGVYRMHRAGGAVVYVGKAASLRQRVSSHFQARSGERALEMLSQVREVTCTETATALEAALLEADEIKRLAPPYNRALLSAGRSVFYATPALDELQVLADARHPAGPLGSTPPFTALAALRGLLAADAPSSLAQRAGALGVEPRWAPEAACFEEGRARFVATHGRLASPRDVRQVGARLWRERRAAETLDDETAELLPRRAWTPEAVRGALEETVLRAAHALRRARWLIRLSESTLAWSAPGRDGRRRVLVFERGAVVGRADLERDAPAPVPPGARRPIADRRASFDVATFDRLRVLTTELRSLADESERLELRVGVHARLSPRRLGVVLRWV